MAWQHRTLLVLARPPTGPRALPPQLCIDHPPPARLQGTYYGAFTGGERDVLGGPATLWVVSRPAAAGSKDQLLQLGLDSGRELGRAQVREGGGSGWAVRWRTGRARHLNTALCLLNRCWAEPQVLPPPTPPTACAASPHPSCHSWTARSRMMLCGAATASMLPALGMGGCWS